MTSYELSRAWFDFCFENPEKINPGHTAVFFFAIEHCNRLGWKDKFGFPSQMAMDAIGIRKYQTYVKFLNDLVEWGFFKMIQKSKNQYSANIICLQRAMPKNGKALDKAIKKHGQKQLQSTGQSTGQSMDSIDKPINQELYNQEQERGKRTKFLKPGYDEVESKFQEKAFGQSWDYKIEAQKFYGHYESNGWKVGKNPMKDWEAAIGNWVRNIGAYGKTKSDKTPISATMAAGASAVQHFLNQEEQ